jgi:hypothetical protein
MKNATGTIGSDSKYENRISICVTIKLHKLKVVSYTEISFAFWINKSLDLKWES